MKILKLIDKFNNSPKGQLAKSIFCLLFSLILITTATFAWIASNVTTTLAGMGISVLDGGSYARYSAFYIDDIDAKSVGKINQSITGGTESLQFELRTYDKTFTSLNAYARVVVRLEIYNLSENNVPTENETKSLSISITRNQALDPSTSSALGGVFSSVGQVGCYTSSQLDFSASNNTIYNTLVNQYVLANNAQTFTSVTNNVISKTTSISLNLNYTANDIKIGSDEKSCLLVYVVFDYNTSLTNLYIEQNEGHISSSNEANILNDLSKMDIAFAQE